jgi:hypothetical protein
MLLGNAIASPPKNENNLVKIGKLMAVSIHIVFIAFY